MPMCSLYAVQYGILVHLALQCSVLKQYLVHLSQG